MSEEERIAPVIPLFGGEPVDRDPAGDEPGATRGAEDSDGTSAAAQNWHTTWRDLGSRAEDRRPRPVAPLQVKRSGGVRFVELPEEDDEHAGAPAPDEARAEAEERLIKSLRRRSLSVSEARAALRQADLDAEAVDEIVDRLTRLGALDDVALAAQLVRAGVERKKQGRRAIAQMLAARGVDRAVIDDALAELPDDDLERALDYARTKAPQLLRFDDDTALRRLAGQLARRGFGGGLAMSAARTALSEARRPRGSVRFD
ncbi:regulatory protein RecX [Microbacterium album]|uniref:Regulatory protein RecX n=1 Tax=Microbacterium album TaxID=2053191 RepID=A0A917MMC9_9MICO|nr:regulatory protein RecX [Microbacterium album]GGH46330.1 hypothetical protein GCM10010921_22320 [Microbacterium album]